MMLPPRRLKALSTPTCPQSGRRGCLSSERLERFIGVIYRPETERLSRYAHVELSRQFDGYVWFDDTHAITPLLAEVNLGRVPDTYPFGL